MPNSTKKCLTKSEISKMGPDYIYICVFRYIHSDFRCLKSGLRYIKWFFSIYDWVKRRGKLETGSSLVRKKFDVISVMVSYPNCGA